MVCSCALAAAVVVLRADRRKRLADPLDPAVLLLQTWLMLGLLLLPLRLLPGAIALPLQLLLIYHLNTLHLVTSFITSSPCTFNVCSFLVYLM